MFHFVFPLRCLLGWWNNTSDRFTPHTKYMYHRSFTCHCVLFIKNVVVNTKTQNEVFLSATQWLSDTSSMRSGKQKHCPKTRKYWPKCLFSWTEPLFQSFIGKLNIQRERLHLGRLKDGQTAGKTRNRDCDHYWRCHSDVWVNARCSSWGRFKSPWSRALFLSYTSTPHSNIFAKYLGAQTL